MLQMEALNRRLPENHKEKEYISGQARNLRTGYLGEKSLDFELNFLPEKKYRILQTLKLRDPHGLFEIDTLMLTTHFALIIEIKNIFGTITFDGMGQVTRSTEKIEEGFNNPIEQVNLQHFRLRRWLQKHQLPPFPLEKIVVYSNPRTIIKNLTNNKTINEMVIHRYNVLSKISELSQAFDTPCLTEQEVVKLSKLLIDEHQVEKQDVLAKFQITVKELLKGVFCSVCGTLPMEKIYGKWRCNLCGHTDKNAYLPALGDYALLVSPIINNRQAREFLQLESIHVTKKLLQKAGYEQFGTTSARKYKMEYKNEI